jgi:hypothetical protein
MGKRGAVLDACETGKIVQEERRMSENESKPDICPECGAGTLDSYGKCNECFYPEDHPDPYCRICGTPLSEECEHLILRIYVESLVDPAEGLSDKDWWYLPDCLYDIFCENVDWSEEQLAEAFGTALPLLDAYVNGLFEPPSWFHLYMSVGLMLPKYVRMTLWEHPCGPGGCGYWLLWWSDREDEAWEQFDTLVRPLQEGFKRLAQMPPAVRSHWGFSLEEGRGE